jgi:hypothetical protein
LNTKIHWVASYNLDILGLKMNTKTLLVAFAIVAAGFGLSAVAPALADNLHFLQYILSLKKAYIPRKEVS